MMELIIIPGKLWNKQQIFITTQANNAGAQWVIGGSQQSIVWHRGYGEDALALVKELLD